MHRHLFLTHLITSKSFCVSKTKASISLLFASNEVQRTNHFAPAKRKQAAACYLRVIEFNEQIVLRQQNESKRKLAICE